MSFSITYKRLFELQLQHGYFLNRGNRTEDYALANNPEYDIRKEVDLVPTAKTEKFLRRHNMQFTNTPTGAYVALHVVEDGEDTDGVLFKSFQQIPAEPTLTFQLKPKNPFWADYTNQRIFPNVPAIFYFSNFRHIADLNYPYLHLPASTYIGGRYYEMGELFIAPILSAPNAMGTYYAWRPVVDTLTPTNNGSSWERITVDVNDDDFQFATYRDRMLLPSKFTYSFTPVDGVEIRNGSFQLSDANGPVGSAIDFNNTDPILSYPLDFSTAGPGNTPLQGLYELEVTTDSGYQDRKEIFINDELYDPKVFGVIEVGQRTGLGDFALFDDNQHLIRDEDGKLDPPVFQLRLRNRRTYWQYVINEAQTLAPPVTSDVRFFDATETRLETKRPVPLTESMTEVFYIRDNTQSPQVDERVLLPNPAQLDLVVRLGENHRQFTEIYLPILKV